VLCLQQLLVGRRLQQLPQQLLRQQQLCRPQQLLRQPQLHRRPQQPRHLLRMTVAQHCAQVKILQKRYIIS
jgi:hypothetical protein